MRIDLPGRGTLDVAALAPRLVRLRFALDGARGHRGYLDAAAIETRPDAAAGLVLHHDRDAGRLVLAEDGGAELLRLGLESALAAGRLELTLELVGEQHLYGLGQAGGAFDRLGTSRRLWNVHVNHGQGGDIAIALLLSHRGYGLFFDATGAATIDPGDSNDRTLLRYAGDGDSVDLYVLGGGTLRATMADVAALLGRAPMPPRWALGYLQSTRHFGSLEEIGGLARALRARDLPCDAIILLSTYRDMLGWNRGVGHLEPAPGLEAQLAELRACGFRVATHEYPVLHRDSPLFATAAARGYLLAAGFPDEVPATRPSASYDEGQRYVDFAQPAAARWWWEAHRDLCRLEVDGWWVDGGEGPPAGTPAATGDGAAGHNDYDLHRQRAFAEGEARERPGRRTWMLSRSGGPGMQRFGAACWSGDVNNSFATLEAQVPIGLNVGLSGVPYWGTDIGGYYPVAPRSAELFVRWFQFGAFCGVFRAHGRNWRDHLPYGHGEEADAACRRVLELRYRLSPYTYALAWQAHALGLPPMRPLVMNYPDDPNVWEMGHQFLWGDDILVAPVTRAGARHWPVYLPRGTWIDFWTWARYAGPGAVSVGAPLDRIPLFVRAGAILPFAPLAATLGGGPPGELALEIHPEGESRFTLYDDDGETTAYRDGAHALTAITCRADAAAIAVEIAAPSGRAGIVPRARSFALRIHAGARPREVAIDTAARAAAAWRLEDERIVVVEGLTAPASVTLRM